MVKTRFPPPFKQAEFDIIYGQGISQEGSILDLAADQDIIRKSGAWYSYGDTRMGQGRENAREFLRKNPEITLELENRLREMFDLPAGGEKEAE